MSDILTDTINEYHAWPDKGKVWISRLSDGVVMESSARMSGRLDSYHLDMYAIGYWLKVLNGQSKAGVLYNGNENVIKQICELMPPHNDFAATMIARIHAQLLNGKLQVRYFSKPARERFARQSPVVQQIQMIFGGDDSTTTVHFDD